MSFEFNYGPQLDGEEFSGVAMTEYSASEVIALVNNCIAVFVATSTAVKVDECAYKFTVTLIFVLSYPEYEAALEGTATTCRSL
jgi:hypothetical protein